ncbi:MAG: hypothetical protein A3H60_02920 [Candidatus Zambryskibacteria bacterium RIFCSPLOWO2_02_FULL_44_12b]|uniref:SCP domain-containing protein n=1 Tax=Candidatus Zambryskibacteria bacterium RIFCSPLOWO2_02_FULL_44_12b TaxID=1802772 RepID=A0A1G2UKS9_9BACT|nr:MAG: hypothetical protein A3H60_02920 [Candidatus Zambryskibacteria bacterium RIFCSPLOWO2_02_FULL_44_12b]
MRKRLKNHFIPHEGNNYKPHSVRERHVVGMALLAVAIFGLAFSIKSLITRNPDLLSAVITGVLVDLTNSNRLAQNINPLTFNPVLAEAAQLKANDMAEKSYFAHTSPEGKTPWYWFTESGYNFLYAGENLAVNFVDSEDVVLAWMNSPGHRANIVNNNFTEIGIAMASGRYNGQDSIYVVQLFGHPMPQTQKISEVLDVEVLAENKMFIAVKNNDYVVAEETEVFDTGLVAEASVVEKAIASPKMLLKTIYVVIGSIVFVSLLLFLAFKRRREHTKHVVYSILLLILIVTLFYLASAKLFPQILVE